jgi:hypothetical protein
LALRRLDVCHGDLAGAPVFLGIERHLLALDKPTHSGTLKCGGVDKNILAAIIWLDETKALLVVVEFHGAVSHEYPFADPSAVLPKTRVRATWGVTCRCLEGLNVRLAFSVGETARLSGQMSILIYLRDKRGVSKAATGALFEGNVAGRKIAIQEASVLVFI